MIIAGIVAGLTLAAALVSPAGRLARKIRHERMLGEKAKEADARELERYRRELGGK